MVEVLLWWRWHVVFQWWDGKRCRGWILIVVVLGISVVSIIGSRDGGEFSLPRKTLFPWDPESKNATWCDCEKFFCLLWFECYFNWCSALLVAVTLLITYHVVWGIIILKKLVNLHNDNLSNWLGLFFQALRYFIFFIFSILPKNIGNKQYTNKNKKEVTWKGMSSFNLFYFIFYFILIRT